MTLHSGLSIGLIAIAGLSDKVAVNNLTGPRSETVETRGESSRWWGLGYILCSL